MTWRTGVTGFRSVSFSIRDPSLAKPAPLQPMITVGGKCGCSLLKRAPADPGVKSWGDNEDDDDEGCVGEANVGVLPCVGVI